MIVIGFKIFVIKKYSSVSENIGLTEKING